MGLKLNSHGYKIGITQEGKRLEKHSFVHKGILNKIEWSIQVFKFISGAKILTLNIIYKVKFSLEDKNPLFFCSFSNSLISSLCSI